MLFLNSTYKEHSAITGTAHTARFAAFEKIEFGCPNPAPGSAFIYKDLQERAHLAELENSKF